MKYLYTLVVSLFALTAAAQKDVSFLVSFDESLQSTPANGRLTVYLMRTDSGIRFSDPADAPFYENPQPMFSIDATGLLPGEVAVINDDNCEFFPVLPSELEPGRYLAQAVLDQSRTASNWKFENGNLHSSPDSAVFEVTKRGVIAPVHINLEMSTTKSEPRGGEGLWYISVKSDLLSELRGTDVYLRAGIVEPLDMDFERRYPVVYQIPGFGGNHTGASGMLERYTNADPDSDSGRLARNAYWIVLDPEGPNGHHLFADSANNGPVGKALIQELIPKIDASCRTIPKNSARLLRGHSSGGWSTIWLGITYPDTFGGIWSSSPDPVDFSSFQAVNIYNEPNMYRHEELGQIVWNTSYSDADGVKGMTIRDENRMEEVIGPGNTSGQQWDSWLAAFGPVNDQGEPADLYLAQTGEIDSRIAKHFTRYDIAKKLADNRATLGPLMKDRLRLVVGDMDNYDLDEAVLKLKAQLDALTFAAPTGGFSGYIEIVPGLDHSSIFRSDAIRDFSRQMLNELTRQGHIKAEESK
jgi:hypothetical protein